MKHLEIVDFSGKFLNWKMSTIYSLFYYAFQKISTKLAFTPHLQPHIHFRKSISTQNRDHQQKVSRITTKGQE